MPPARRRKERLSLAQARRIALAAQGFADPRPPGEPDGWALRRVLDRVGLIQIDSVNVLQRAHYLPLFARLGPYSTDLLDRASWRAPRRLFEYWGHEASLIPVTLQPHLRWRMDRAAHEAWGGMRRVQEERPELVARVLEEVRDRGPIAASDVAEEERPARTGPWWDWSDVKRAFEWLFWSGQITSARRRGFERLYDLPERVLPPAVTATPTPPVEDAQRELVRVAARAYGVASERDLRDYFRLPVAEARARVAELVESGELWPVRGRGLDGARLPASARRGSRARCRRGPWSARSTRWCGSARARSGCSTSATGSRSTSRSPSGSTATTCCRSCSGTGWSPASTSRRTARRGSCACRPRTPSRTRRPRRPRS